MTFAQGSHGLLEASEVANVCDGLQSACLSLPVSEQKEGGEVKR